MNGRASVADAKIADERRIRGLTGSLQGATGLQGSARGGSTYLSLFSGIGGLDLAIEAFGYRCVGQVEIDEWCRSQLGRHWPTVPRWGDVAEVGAASYAERTGGEARGQLPGPHGPNGQIESVGHRVDLICGGFPCQPVSHAGRRKGQADSRWLWPEFARLVGELRPRIVVVENVPGLLSIDGGRAVSEVVGDLASMGYVGRHGLVRASDVGAPHRRERFFLVAYAIGDRLEGFEPAGTATGPALRDRDGATADAGSMAWTPTGERDGRPRTGGIEASRGNQGEAFDGTTGRAGIAWGPYGPSIRRWERVMGPAPAPLDSGRLSADFVEWMMGLLAGWTEGKRNQRLKALGNAVVPQQATLALSLLGLEHLAVNA